MRRITPSSKAKSGPSIEVSEYVYQNYPMINEKKRDFPASVNTQPKKEVSREEILQYENYILEELNNLKINFDKIFSDISFLKSITSDSLRTNESYRALKELFLKTEKEKKEIERFEILVLSIQNGDSQIITSLLGDEYLGEHAIDDANPIPHDNYLSAFNKIVNLYKTSLEQNKTNFRELSEEIKIEEKSIKEIEELKNTASIIKELRSNKMEIVPTSSLITSDKNDEDLESYCFDFFLKIEKSKEKLNKLKSELEDFCQQQSYQELVNLKDPNNNKIQKKNELIIAIRDCQYKIMNNLQIIDKYELKFNELVESTKFPEALTQSDFMKNQLNSFCLELEIFFNSNSLDKFKTELESLLSNPIEISDNPRPTILPPIPEEPRSTLTNDSREIETVYPEKLFQEILKNLLDEQQQKANSITALGQEVSSSCSLFEKLKCLSAKGVDEDEQSKTSYFLINNKLVKLTYNSRDLINSSESDSGNLDHPNEDQFSRFSSEEILEKLSELENLKLKFTSSWASDHQDSPQNPSQDLSQSFLNNFKIEIVEIEDLSENQSIPKSIKKEVNKFQQSTPNVTVSIGCFQALNRGSEKEVAL